MERPHEQAGQAMEHTPEAWDCWFNDEFKLDSDSPMDISDSLWDNMAQSNETVARSLFACTSQGNDSSSGRKEESPQDSSSWHNPSLATESMLNLLAEEHANSSPCLSDSFEGCDGSFANTCEDLPSSNSIWFMPTEDSLSSSPCNEPTEQSAESWMAGCFNDDNDSHAQWAIQHGRHSSDVMAPRPSSISGHGAPCRIRHGRRGGKQSQEFLGSQSGLNTRKFTGLGNSEGKQTPNRRLVRSVSDLQAVQASAKPVVYPFALVKPSGIQGDATLKDINERISTLSPPSGHSDTPTPSTSSPFSGKPVVAVTKIHTEGKGTITIMRTRR